MSSGWQWFSFLGLLVELAGFLLMAADLLPEFKRYRQRRSLREFREGMTPAWFVAQQQSYERHTAEGGVSAVTAAVTFEMGVGKLEALLRSLRVESRLPYPPVQELYLERLELAERTLIERERASENRWRPPLRAAILIVVLGVTLQLVGSLPTELRRSFTEEIGRPLARWLVLGGTGR